MDNVEPRAPEPADSYALREQINDLQHLVVSVLILVVVVSGTLSIYLLRQWRLSSKELAELRPVATEMNERDSRMDTFVAKLKDYGRTHGDFGPTLTRYGLAPTGSPPAAATPAKK